MHCQLEWCCWKSCSSRERWRSWSSGGISSSDSSIVQPAVVVALELELDSELIGDACSVPNGSRESSSAMSAILDCCCECWSTTDPFDISLSVPSWPHSQSSFCSTCDAVRSLPSTHGLPFTSSNMIKPKAHTSTYHMCVSCKTLIDLMATDAPPYLGATDDTMCRTGNRLWCHVVRRSDWKVDLGSMSCGIVHSIVCELDVVLYEHEN